MNLDIYVSVNIILKFKIIHKWSFLIFFAKTHKTAI
jgi:hypothetical protein